MQTRNEARRENSLEIANIASLLFVSFMLVLVAQTGSAQNFEAARALDEWRWGVLSYNDGKLGKALLAFERAISLNPTDPDMREWLGKSYWRSGMEREALDLWNQLMNENQASIALQNKMEQLQHRMSGNLEVSDDEWISLTSFHGLDDDIRFFERPSVARKSGDGSGSLLVTSYADGTLLRIDANGSLVERFTGGLEGFDRPFDVLPIPDDRLIVSEFQSDRISVLSLTGYNRGSRIEIWGESGRDRGQFLGPQYMALSQDKKFVYVSDWGNRRVSKWNLNGQHILSLERGNGFDGFEGPSGIAGFEGRVYVADSLKGTVEVFDPSGNYLGVLINRGLTAPEGLCIYKGDLLIADVNRIFRVNLLSGEMVEEAYLGAGEHRITSVIPDDNGNLAICDFDADRITLLTPLSTLYGGLEVTLDRVRGDAYPEMAVDLTVRDRLGQPISGLKASNFRVFDGENPIDTPNLDWASSEDNSVSIVGITDLSGTNKDVEIMLEGVEDLARPLREGDTFSLVGTGQNAVLHEIDPERPSFSNLVGTAIGNRPISWDESLRLAAARLIPERRGKAIIAFVNRPPGMNAFDRHGLYETARLMVNNGIIFYPVYRDSSVTSSELDYIATQTGGHASLIFQAEGSGALVGELRNTGVGRYTITWSTRSSSAYGRKFLPVSVEVIYIKKSGRDESGTFAPLS
ncbi:hypothetical protein S1OALGB6SA_1075 [Olavius algarvensis spirochete endosymbiont]|uniref:hypothetical protein n=1 Tax=Olavius algarvensis spirochete endosymbiont TaxID=260710 RepID=UPI00052CF134|nr:hypothetical protein [Olavius algarvensis spirochete endosymbiont]KGM43262.1 hypothetical protein JY97_08585 [Alkalispirochaeta odontotermitis]VDB00002.1 hypothetical protein S1OALGB6SA_1075 [Olavius algarvensis spirochete endosymbiont]